MKGCIYTAISINVNEISRSWQLCRFVSGLPASSTSGTPADDTYTNAVAPSSKSVVGPSPPGAPRELCGSRHIAPVRTGRKVGSGPAGKVNSHAPTYSKSPAGPLGPATTLGNEQQHCSSCMHTHMRTQLQARKPLSKSPSSPLQPWC